MENPLVDEMVATPTTRHLSAQQILTRAVEIREEHIWRTLKGAGAKERERWIYVSRRGMRFKGIPTNNRHLRFSMYIHRVQC